MLLVPVVSSDIAAAGYDPDTSELQIQFTTGRIYSYQNVPPLIYQLFLEAPSKGSFFARNIKNLPGIYLYTRLL